MSKDVDSNQNTSIQSRFGKLFETSQWSDCTFVVDHEEFRAHRLVLATSSPVFEVMFYGPLAQENTIHVKDMSPVEFKQLLSFVYTDQVSLESVDNAWQLLYAAKKYLLTSLSQQCLEYIKSNLSATNVLSSYELAEMYEERNVQKTCIDIIRKYTPVVLSCDYHMSASTLRMILEQNSLNASEWELTCAAITWSEEECSFRDMPNTQKNKRAVLVEAGVLRKLRFMTLPLTHVNICSALCEILTVPEIDILQKQIYNNSNNMLLDINSDRQLRCSVALPCYTAPRWILKGASILRVHYTCFQVKTSIVTNRRVLICNFTIPTRLSTRWLSQLSDNHEPNTYTESFIVSIVNTRTNNQIVPNTFVKANVPHSASMKVKLSEPAMFESGVDYDVIIRWPFENFDLNAYEYSLDNLSPMAERKGITFKFNSEYDLIQSISYTPYSI